MRADLRVGAVIVAVASTVPGFAVILDRIAATVDGVAITASEIEQYETMRLVPRLEDEDEVEYERRVLNFMINQLIRYRDVQRFGLAEVTEEQVDEAVESLVSRFASRDAFERAMSTSEMTMERLRLVLRRRLEIETFIQLRFSPMVFVSLEEIEGYYRDVWIEQRLAADEPIRPLADVRDQIRAILKLERLEEEVARWSEDLRDRANIDIFI